MEIKFQKRDHAVTNLIRMRKYLFLLMAVLAVGGFFSSCGNDDTDTSEFHDWKNRNDVFFDSIRTLGLDSMKQAQRLYGDNWQDHCNWRTYLSYSLDDSVANTSKDSLYVQIIKRGTGSGCPYGSDSCRVFYRGRIIPSASYPEGYVFSHSGQSTLYNDIFNRNLSVPSIKKATTFVHGFTTALLHMHIGDRWRLYMSYPLGYGSSTAGTIPSYSDMIYEVELVAYYRNGTVVPPWN